MSQITGILVILAHVMLWLFYSTPLCQSSNPNYVFRFEKYQRKFNHSLEAYGPKSTYYGKSFDNGNKLHGAFINTIRPNIVVNVSSSKRKYSRKSQFVFSPVQLLTPSSFKFNNSFHRLTRRRRSEDGTVSGSSDSSNATILVAEVGRNAISKAVTSTGNAFSRSYAPGPGISKAESYVKNGGNAIAKAKSLESNSTAIAISKGGGHALSASDSGNSGNAQSTSMSEGNGSSRAVASVLEGHVVATGIHRIEIEASDMSHTNDYPPLRPAQDLSSMRIDFDDPFFRAGFKTTVKPKDIETTPFQVGRSFNTVKPDNPYSTTEFYIPSSTSKFNISPSTPESKTSTSTPESKISSSIPESKTSTSTPESKTSTSTPESKISTSAPEYKISTSAPDILQPTTELNISPSTANNNISQSRNYIYFHKGDHQGSYIVFESNASSKCNNIPRKLVGEWNFVKTDACMMIYDAFNCKSYTSRRFEPGTSFSRDFLIHSFHICDNNDGGPTLNLDFTEYYAGWTKLPRVLKSYKDVCQCMNIPKAVHNLRYWSINNHGNELMAYYENDCKEAFVESTYILDGHSYETRNIYYLKKSHRQILSFGPAKNSTYFRTSCLKLGRSTFPSVVKIKES